MEADVDAAVVGGGLAGLAAAAYLANAGLRVVVIERSPAVGGRARSDRLDGFALNRGPHALYAGGAGVPVLRELGVAIAGGFAPRRGVVLDEDGRGVLPVGVGSLLRSRLSPRAKVEALRWFAALPRRDPAPA